MQVLGVADITARLHLNHGLGWLPPELNLGRLDLFFYFLAGAGPALTSSTCACQPHCPESAWGHGTRLMRDAWWPEDLFLVRDGLWLKDPGGAI